MIRRVLPLVLVAILTAGGAAPAGAVDAGERFARGTRLLSLEAGAGAQDNLEGGFQSDLEFWYAGARVSLVPFGPTGVGGPFYGAFDVSLEPLYVRYSGPTRAFFAGLGAVGRYHFLSLGRLAPFVEAGAFAGGTDLEVPEIDSAFTFLLEGTVGLAYFVADNVSLYAGYRFIHVSNGNTDRPNRGFEAHSGLAGVTFHFR
ncbi:MAG: acyloxyacyl hydrolase [Candidatus Rokubacteria bacterium]|nr:acyloxyacyl hydrolase [Candidatus Rokubacteria bacterium]